MNFDQIIDRRGTESIKWNYYEEDVLPMWIADMDFRSPYSVIEALHKRVSHGIFGYGWEPEGLKDAIITHVKKRQHCELKPEEISFISGVVTGFTHAMYSLTKPGDKVLIQTPVYPPILKGPESIGRLSLYNELIRQDDGKYEIDFDDFEKKVAFGVKLFLLCNPHNPVGRVFSRYELERMAEICLKHGVLICSDEIHCDLVYSESQHVPISSLSPEIADITVTYFAPSKTFNIAGFSTSVYVTKNPIIRKKLSESMRMLLGHPNILGLHAARAAYRDSQDWLDEALNYMEANRDFLVSYVSEELPGVDMWCPEGTFLGWLDCRSLDIDQSPADFFLEKAKVGLNDGADFGVDGTGFVRLNFGCPRQMLVEGLERIKSAVMSL
ncbi:MAG: MalY/PatB family protein [Brevefilum sp.]|nr:MalY/PatB family protein [Brevefilum sp.]